MDVQKNNSTMVGETPAVESDKAISVDISVGEDKGKVRVDEIIVNKIS